MQLLGRSIPALLLVLITTACSPAGPLTPGDALEELRQAFLSGDAAMLQKNLSTRSRKRFMAFVTTFNRMPGEQKKSLAKEFGIPMAGKGTLTLGGYMQTVMKSDEGKQLLLSLRGEVVARDLQETTARIAVSDGMVFRFVKEGPYWRFDYP